MAGSHPGSRGFSTCTLLSLFLLAFSSTAAAYAVLGIDLGTNFIKAVIVKPGTPLDIVLTKDSKRKEAAAIGFKPTPAGPYELGKFPERLYGGDAVALAGRFPGDVYMHLKPLLGVDPTKAPVVEEFSSRYPAIKVDTSRSAAALSSSAFSTEEQPWSVEELLAMELKNIRRNAEAMVGKGSKVTDVVITVPSFYTSDERRAVERAANLAGLTVMGLVSDGLAVGIDYSVKRDAPNVSRGGKAEVHLVFDMGASSTTATVLKFQSRDVKDVGKYNKTIYEVSTLGAGWDRGLGGNALNSLISDYLIEEFVKKPQASSAGISAADLKGHGRTASKLWREAERARQVLSANSDVRSSFEGLYDDIDFAAKITRTQFEELASDFASRVQVPVKQALEAAKLTVKDLDSIILFGGANRTPFVQKALQTLAGKDVEIRSNVNADESAAFGAAFKAASLSPAFRVKDIRDAESAVYAAGINQQKARQQQVFIPTSLASTPKQIQFKDKEDFAFTLYQKVDGTDREIRRIETSNLTASVAALHDKFGCTAADVTTSFTLRLSPVNGLPEVVSGSVSCKVEGTGKKAGIVDSVKGLFGSKKDAQEPLEDTHTTTQSSSSSSASASASSSVTSSKKNDTSKKDKKDKKDAAPVIRIESITVAFSSLHEGLPVPDEKESKRIAERLAAFDRSDKARVQREEAYNTLEGFTYRARDLVSEAGFESVSSQAVRDQITALLGKTSEWLSEEGATSTIEVLKSKLKDLKALTDPVQKRQKEALLRPESLKQLENSLNQTQAVLYSMASQVAEAAAKASASAKSAAEAAASTVSSAVTPSSTDADDLEDDDSASTTTTADTPLASAKDTLSQLMSPYTQEDVDDFTKMYESVKGWLAEKAELQSKIPSYEDAALTVKEIEERTQALNQAMVSIVQKKVQAKRTADAKKWAKNKTKSAKSAASSASSVVSKSATSMASEAEATFSSASSVVGKSATSVASAASEAVSGAAEQAADAAQQATESVKSAASDATESAKSVRDEL